MDSRTAAHVLSQIGAYLAVSGGRRFNARAYTQAARAILALDADDLTPLYRSGEHASTHGVGPATLSVIRELVETGESSYHERLRDSTPAGLFELLRVPGLGAAKVALIHRELGVEDLDDLEAAAIGGRLAKLPRFGPKTAARILKGIAFARHAAQRSLYHRGLHQAELLKLSIERHPDVTRAIIAGSVRRHNETIGDIDIVAVCDAEPAGVRKVDRVLRHFHEKDASDGP